MQNFDYLALAIAVNTEHEAEQNYNQKLKPLSDSTSNETEINPDIDIETGKQMDSCQDSERQHTSAQNQVECSGKKVSNIRDCEEGNMSSHKVTVSQKPERRIGKCCGQFLCRLSRLNQGHGEEKSDDASDSDSYNDDSDDDDKDYDMT